jgi:3',5'-cyclic AMP phosphodiesterase CpdA
MYISSAFIYITVLSVATVVISIAGVMWLIHKEPGQRIFWRDLALVFLISFYIPGAIFFFNRDMSLWWLLIPVLSLSLAFKHLLAAMSWKSVPLIRIAAPAHQNVQKPTLRIAHLSDLHLCAGSTTLEGGLPRDKVIEANRRALAWACQQTPDLIAITGDTTDTGAHAEWEIFESLVGELSHEWRSRVVFVPGNHDLTIQRRRYGAENDGDALLDFESRCMALVQRYFSMLPQDSKLLLLLKNLTDSDEIELGALRTALAKPLEVIARFPPRRETTGEMTSGLWRKIASRAKPRRQDIAWRHSLDDYVPGIVIPDELRATFNTDDGFWPKRKYPLVQDLLHELFPIIVFENDRFFVVALNSNTVRSSWLVDGALGEIGGLQLTRLILMLERRPKNKVVVVLLHHHIGCPHDIQHKIARTMVELKALQLREGRELAGVLETHGAPSLVLHGHKHAGYWAKANDITVLSAASVPYGNKLGGPNCSAVAVDDGGEVSLYASATITCGGAA